MSSIASVTFSNLSSRSFARDNFGLSTSTTAYSFISPGTDIEAWLLAFSQTPAANMSAGDAETMAVDGTSLSLFTLESLLQAEFEIFCVWDDSTSGARFGVKIHIPVQILDIGTRPYWYVMSDSASPGTDPNWVLSGSDSSQPYSWDGVPGLTINAATVSEHSSLGITVNITNAA